MALRSRFNSRSIAFFPSGGLKCERIEEQVDVFGKTLDQVPALRKACTALENDLVARGPPNDSQRLGDVVVLLDNCRTQSPSAKMFRRPKDRLLKVKDARRVSRSRVLCLPMMGAIQCSQNAEVEPRQGIQALPKPPQDLRPLAELLPNRTEHGAHARWFRVGDFEEPLETPFFRHEFHDSPDGHFRR